jgi:hypothetical protein
MFEIRFVSIKSVSKILVIASILRRKEALSDNFYYTGQLLRIVDSV